MPHIHYVRLSRVTTIEGLFITNLSGDKIAVSHEVKREMQHLRDKGRLKVCNTPILSIIKIIVAKYRSPKSKLGSYVYHCISSTTTFSAHLIIKGRRQFISAEKDSSQEICQFGPRKIFQLYSCCRY